MKLQYKALILIALTWALLLALTFVKTIRYSSLNFAMTTILFSLLIFFLVYAFIINRIKQLNQKVTKAISSDGHLDTKGNDEIALISKQINNMLDIIKVGREQLEQRIGERTQELEKKTIQLQQEISEHISTEKRLTEHRETLSKLAHYDTLTSLPNRVFFNEILNKSINHAKRHKKLCAILLVDLDAFKKININYGHTIGDIVLKEISNRISNILRADDILAKLDGDQFIVLLNDINKAKFASTVAEKILSVCSQPVKVDSYELSLTASIGICIYPDDGDALEILLKNIDTALQKAKQSKGNSYQFYTQEMDIEAHEFIQLENALRKAIEKNELALYYQPKLNLKKGTISGVEALVRWVHPTLGTINPAKFIPIAEETGLIMQLGAWAIKEACQTNKYWQDEGYEHITVAINLSPKQFQHRDIAKIIDNILKETKLNPYYLEIEINEITIMEDVESAQKILDEIKTTGVVISIDHFGTGYTSISHLKQLPISILKIDQTFIKGTPHTPNDNAITNAFIALGHNLGLEIVAAGVETAEQVQYLALQNCDMVQGYFLSYPLPAQKIVSQFNKLMEEVLI